MSAAIETTIAPRILAWKFSAMWPACENDQWIIHLLLFRETEVNGKKFRRYRYFVSSERGHTERGAAEWVIHRWDGAREDGHCTALASTDVVRWSEDPTMQGLKDLLRDGDAA